MQFVYLLMLNYGEYDWKGTCVAGVFTSLAELNSHYASIQQEELDWYNVKRMCLNNPSIEELSFMYDDVLGEFVAMEVAR